jgi:hypothetical protein
MRGEVVRPEMHRAQVSGGVAADLIGEMGRGRDVAFPADADGAGGDAGPNSTAATKLLPLVP